MNFHIADSIIAALIAVKVINQFPDVVMKVFEV